MSMKVLAVAAVSAAIALAGGAAEAGVVGSASLATMRNCGTTAPTARCDGSGPGQQVKEQKYGGGVGVGGLNHFSAGAGNRAWSLVDFDPKNDLPLIKAFSKASGNVRVNINAIAFQTYKYTGAAPVDFSISGSLHIVDSSANPAGGALPGGAIFSQYLGIWDPATIAGLSSAQELFSRLFYAGCGTAGVLGAASAGGDLTGGERNVASLTTAACAPGSLTLAHGQEVLVVAGLQLPVNRGGFADATSTFTTRLGDDLAPEARQQLEQNIASAISQGAILAVPEPASWAMMISGFGIVGAAARRRQVRGETLLT
jgi:hypothetical protein